ncbi:MAG: ribosome maturation factor RimM [Chloroflexota bacterium]
MSGKKGRPAGSLKSGEPAFLAAGKVRRPHGVRGEVVVELYTDFPERLCPRTQVYLGEKHLPLTLRSARSHNEGLLLGFEGIDTPEAAGHYRNQVLYIAAKSLPDLAAGEHYFHQLIGLNVADEDGNLLGILTEIVETGANDVYVVTGADGKELLLPAIPSVVLDVDLPAKTMKVHLLPGLVEETGEG